MSQQAPNFPLNVPMAWHQVWMRVLTQPSPITFQAVLTDPTASNRRAYTWTAVAALIEIGLALLVQIPSLSQFSTMVPTTSGTPPVSVPATFLGIYVCMIPLVPVLAVVGLIINVAITQFVAKSLGGVGTYGELTYVFAAYQAPVTLLSTVLTLSPVGFCLALPLSIYSFMLHLMAIKGVNQFSYWRAFFSVVLVPLALIAVVIVFAIFASAASHR